MVFTWQAADALYDELLHWLVKELPQGLAPYGIMIFLYVLGGEKISQFGAKETAYGGRDAKWIIHYKHLWQANNPDVHTNMVSHARSMSKGLSKHLPCRGFYNYIDKDMPCTHNSNDEFLSATMSDVEKMRKIKMEVDPNSVFRSRLFPCGRVTCTSEILGQPATPGGATCREKISVLKRNMSENAACQEVGMAFSEKCGACAMWPPRMVEMEL